MLSLAPPGEILAFVLSQFGQPSIDSSVAFLVAGAIFVALLFPRTRARN